MGNLAVSTLRGLVHIWHAHMWAGLQGIGIAKTVWQCSMHLVSESDVMEAGASPAGEQDDSHMV